MNSVRLGLATIFVVLLLAVLARAKEDPAEAYRSYIVFLSPPADAGTMSPSAYREYLQKILPRTLTGERRLMMCTAIFPGFAASLTEAELAEVAKLPGFLRARPEAIGELLTIG